MPIYFQKPENALKRANEFVEVGKKEAALDVLYDVIRSKKHRAWQKIHEPILQRYLSLCVDLKRSVNAKEGLYQYKLICQQVNIISLEEIISYFLKLADEMAEGARNKSLELVTVEDLDMVQTPEGIILSSVSNENAQDRSDKMLLTPWVKFLWEAYRNVLELLRNNNRLERLYHSTAQEAFRFCLKYKRRAEFRKLCNLIKNHLDQVLKYQQLPTSVNLNNPETLQMNLETRLFQLESAITMELWQEAYRAIEGIHYLMDLSKKPPKPQMLANYYEKVALVFFKADNYLFHAAALLKLFILIKEQKKNVTQEELECLGTKVLLAALSIDIAPGQSAMEEYLNFDVVEYDKDKKLASVFDLVSVPTRKKIMSDLSVVLPFVSANALELYESIEEKFQPTRLCEKVHVLLKGLGENEQFKLYTESIERVAVIRMLKQVSQIYETMHFDQLLAIVPFSNEFALQRIIVEEVKKGHIQITIDHRQRSLVFGSALVVAMKEEVPEGPHIQPMPSEILRSQLFSLLEGVSGVMMQIKQEEMDAERKDELGQIIEQYLKTERKEHAHLLNRKQIIEARKEQIENFRHEQEKHERLKLTTQQEKLRAAEESRLEEERERREKERRIAEMKQIQKQQVWDRVTMLRETESGKKAFKYLTPEEIEEMDPQDILMRQAKQLNHEKQQIQLKMRAQEKKVDYFARAMRIEEIQKLEEFYAKQSIEDRQQWDEEERIRIENSKKEHAIAVNTKASLVRMEEDKKEFLDKLFGNRQAEHQERVNEFERNVEAVKQERLEIRRNERVAARRQNFIIARREEKRKEQEEMRKREEEREKKRLEEEAAQRKKEQEEADRKRDEILQKQLKREQEVEERRLREQSQQAPPDVSGGERPSAPAFGGSSGKYVPPQRRQAAEQSSDRGDSGWGSSGGSAFGNRGDRGGWGRNDGGGAFGSRNDGGSRWSDRDGGSRSFQANRARPGDNR